jgi:hypothetical protein
MKNSLRIFVVFVCLPALFPISTVYATNRYVSLTGGNVSPYTSWATAANTIQDAIDVCGNGDIVFVTNGIYAVGGGESYSGALFNRIIAQKTITITSVNGPDSTIILGQGPLGIGAVRCVYLSKNAALCGFTLSNGHTHAEGDTVTRQSGAGAFISFDGLISNCLITCNTAQQNGGGILCSQGGTIMDSLIINNVASNDGGGLFIRKECQVSDCIIVGNYAEENGGGLFCEEGGTFISCSVYGNDADHFGGGAALFHGGLVDNCLFTRNGARSGGGIAMESGGETRNCTLAANGVTHNGGGIHCTGPATNFNTLIYYNSAGISGKEYYLQGDPTFFGYCCTTPDPGGVGNVTNSPQCVERYAFDFHLSSSSPCIGKGNNIYATNPTDLDGRQRIIGNPQLVDIGCYEFVPQHYDTVSDHYVSFDGNNRWPYTSWATAAHGIQDAIDASVNGDSVHVAEGTYDKGYRGIRRFKNRLLINKSISVVATNGDPSQTVICGTRDLEYGSLGINAVRGVYITNTALLSGFTIREGHTDLKGHDQYELTAGGIYADPGCTISNCILIKNYGINAGGAFVNNCRMVDSVVEDNRADEVGGGLLLFLGAHASECIINDNDANQGGGVYAAYAPAANAFDESSQVASMNGITVLENCHVCSNNGYASGGGVYSLDSVLIDRCIIFDNASIERGGGIMFEGGGRAVSSLLTGNSSINGGGAYVDSAGFIENCTIAANSAVHGGGGLYCNRGGRMYNTIIYDNTRIIAGPSNYFNLGAGALYEYCCTFPTITNSWGGAGNITNAPLFTDVSLGNFRLLEGSPCIDTGTNLPGLTTAYDLDGNPRIYDDTVDMGCYEYIPEPAGIYIILVLLASGSRRITRRYSVSA